MLIEPENTRAVDLLAPKFNWRQIIVTRMDGTPWLWSSMEWDRRWGWVAGRISEELGCDYADVDIREDDDLGDVLTVRGKDMGLLS